MNADRLREAADRLEWHKDCYEWCRADIIIGDANEENTNEYTCDLPVGHEEWHKSFIHNVSWAVESDG